jgi:hypothetical protein
MHFHTIKLSEHNNLDYITLLILLDITEPVHAGYDRV